MSCRKVIYTISHSTRSLEEFILLLQANGIELLASKKSYFRCFDSARISCHAHHWKNDR